MSEEMNNGIPTENEGIQQENSNQTVDIQEVNEGGRGGIVAMLRRDSMLMGILLGTLAPAATFGVIFGITALALSIAGRTPMEVINIDMVLKFILLSLIPSVFIMRHYLLKLKFDRTGRGILLVTFVVAIVFAILEFTVKQ